MNFQTTYEVQTFKIGKTLVLSDPKKIVLIERNNQFYIDNQLFLIDKKCCKMFHNSSIKNEGFIIKKVIVARAPELPPLPVFDEDYDILEVPPPIPPLPSCKIDDMKNFLSRLPKDISQYIKEMVPIPYTLETHIAKHSRYIQDLYKKDRAKNPQKNDCFAASFNPKDNQKYYGIYLPVHYEEKEKAKKLGCSWDNEKKSWYVKTGVKSLREIKSYSRSEYLRFAQIISKWYDDKDDKIEYRDMEGLQLETNRYSSRYNIYANKHFVNHKNIKLIPDY